MLCPRVAGMGTWILGNDNGRCGWSEFCTLALWKVVLVTLLDEHGVHLWSPFLSACVPIPSCSNRKAITCIIISNLNQYLCEARKLLLSRCLCTCVCMNMCMCLGREEIMIYIDGSQLGIRQFWYNESILFFFFLFFLRTIRWADVDKHSFINFTVSYKKKRFSPFSSIVLPTLPRSILGLVSHKLGGNPLCFLSV